MTMMTNPLGVKLMLLKSELVSNDNLILKPVVLYYVLIFFSRENKICNYVLKLPGLNYLSFLNYCTTRTIAYDYTCI